MTKTIKEIENTLWNAPLEPAGDKTLNIGRGPLTSSSGLPSWNHLTTSNIRANYESIKANVPARSAITISYIESAAKDLRELAAKLENDISYFNTQPGQSMAINRFSFLKAEILKIASSLQNK